MQHIQMKIIYMSMSKSKSSNVRVSPGYFTLLCGLLLLADGSLRPATAQAISHQEAVVSNPRRFIEQKVTASDGTANSFFGSAAALQDDTALIGADGDNNFQGAAYIFLSRFGNGRWTEVQKLTASDGFAGDEFGYRVDLSRNTLVVGAFSATVNGVVSQGAAYVFTKSTNTWSENQKLLASDGGLFDNFGASVALYRDTIVVGANGATVNGNPAQGAVYVFSLSNGIWTEAQKLTAQDGAAYDNFGLSVALQGSTILVGSPVANINGHSGQGAVYTFTNVNGIWSFAQKLVASDGGTNDGFGESVALDRGTALVGAYGATVDGHSGQGAAYIFTNSGGTLTETQKLTANDGETNANFGNAVALDNHHALIGADVSTVGGHTSAGKAYIFAETAGAWSQIHTLVASDPATDDFFGAAVALDGPTLLVSTPHPVINGNPYQGAAYFFER
jgi:hypothetical protein